MILIADGGSTKCHWVALDHDGNEVFKAKTKGLNPDVLTTQKLHKRIAESEEISHISQGVERVYFYGSGCGTEENKLRLKRFLEKYFRHAKCEVEEDLLAACLSATTDPGIVCIMGTGSNACYFDGKKRVEVPCPSLGYMIMDEASGSYLGKVMLRAYFYHQMPEDLAKRFEEEFNLSPQNIKNNIYKHQNANAYLAKFAGFIFKHDPLPDFLKKMVKREFEVFVDNWISNIPQAKEVPIHFIGSIAHFSKEVIAEVLEERGYTLGNVVWRPIEGLTRYFQQKIRTELAVD